MTFAVAGGGRVSGSFVARLPRLGKELGPVAAQSFRLASRIVNSIGAGHAVKQYEELNGSKLILICAPPEAVEPIVSALAGAIEPRGKVILLCEAGDSRQLASLQSKGAKVGSVQIIPGFESRYIAEGDAAAVHVSKRLVGQLRGKVEEVSAAKLSVYLAGLSFGGSLFTPLMEASLLCLQDAGMPKATAMRVVEGLFQSTLRAYAYAGRRSWNRPSAGEDLIEALAASNPVLARYYRETAMLAVQLLGGKAPSTNSEIRVYPCPSVANK